MTRAAAFLGLSAAVFTLSSVAYAQTTPTGDVLRAYAYADVIMDGDRLAVVHFDLEVSDPADEAPASGRVLVQVRRDAADVVVVAAAPVALVDNGYAQGVVGIYAEAGVVWDSGEGSTAEVVLSPVEDSDTVVLGSESVIWRNNDTLRDDVVDLLGLTQADAAYSESQLLTGAGQLTEPAGVGYVSAAIPVAPLVLGEIFPGRLVFPELSPDDGVPSTVYQDELDEFFVGTDLENSLEGVEEWTGQPKGVVGGVITIIAAVIAAFVVGVFTKSGLVTLPSMAIVFSGSALMSFLSLTMVGIMAGVAGLVVVFLLVLKRTA